MEDYIDINRQSWNKRAEIHPDSDFYEMALFRKGLNSLKAPELKILGDVTDVRILHLQCHFGQDSISLSRMGAKVTGVDFSDTAIDYARQLALDLGTDTAFICSDIYSLPEILEETFDMVFTTYGTIGWLPDIQKWASVVSHFLRPGGKLIFAEFHPTMWMFDDDISYVQYDYFNSTPIVEDLPGTYACPDSGHHFKSVTWNHGLGEVVSALFGSKMTLESLEEYDYSPFNCLKNMEEQAPGIFRFKHISRRFPIIYALSARKM